MSDNFMELGKALEIVHAFASASHETTEVKLQSPHMKTALDVMEDFIVNHCGEEDRSNEVSNFDSAKNHLLGEITDRLVALGELIAIPAMTDIHNTKKAGRDLGDLLKRVNTFLYWGSKKYPRPATELVDPELAGQIRNKVETENLPEDDGVVLLDTGEVMESIINCLRGKEGEEIARIHNRLCDERKVEYLEDSVWREVD